MHKSGFGRRRLAPRACIADRKAHLRTFMMESLEELGFVTSECADTDELAPVLDAHQPDLVVLGSSIDGIEAGRIIEILAERRFDGQVLVIGPRESIMSHAIRRMGRERGIAMLPPLTTPFSAGTLRAGIATLLPAEPIPSPAVDVGEALKLGWLELWYQRKLNTATLAPCGAEALIRMRHPSWGVVPPADFLPDPADAHFRALSEFVVSRVIADWHYLVQQQGPIDLSINLPAAFFDAADAVDDLCRWMPDHPAFGGLIIEIDCAEAIARLARIVEVAKALQLSNIAIAIDSVGADWPALMDLPAAAFVELKIDRQFIAGCADDRLKQTVCRRIVEFAQSIGARSVANGVESRADFRTVHQIGVDLAQGYLFGKPMALKKFARAASKHPMLMHD
ncbi:diguanylate phosphodiesterase [Rhodopseudomonas palustris]|uniref:Diguanylate phosphodiesterase n=1 Tax=Rhodopseudomonas palustris TaxID=1076 RepID=A0A0D7EA03_RHOPL|nr:diguanylate phosphodiesterase [Rhodopseudomonas palustris]